MIGFSSGAGMRPPLSPPLMLAAGAGDVVMPTGGGETRQVSARRMMPEPSTPRGMAGADAFGEALRHRVNTQLDSCPTPSGAAVEEAKLDLVKALIPLLLHHPHSRPFHSILPSATPGHRAGLVPATIRPDKSLAERWRLRIPASAKTTGDGFAGRQSAVRARAEPAAMKPGQSNSARSAFAAWEWSVRDSFLPLVGRGEEGAAHPPKMRGKTLEQPQLSKPESPSPGPCLLLERMKPGKSAWSLAKQWPAS